jgi:hypothetical protein
MTFDQLDPSAQAWSSPRLLSSAALSTKATSRVFFLGARATLQRAGAATTLFVRCNSQRC